MEVFVAARAPGEAVSLMKRLRKLGMSGRDAAYLASIDPPEAFDPAARANFVAEFEFMVPPAQRSEAARLVGLEGW